MEKFEKHTIHIYNINANYMTEEFLRPVFKSDDVTGNYTGPRDCDIHLCGNEGIVRFHSNECEYVTTD